MSSSRRRHNEQFEAVLGPATRTKHDHRDKGKLVWERGLAAFEDGNLKDIVALLVSLGPERAAMYPLAAAARANFSRLLLATVYERWERVLLQLSTEPPYLDEILCSLVRNKISMKIDFDFPPAGVSNVKQLLTYTDQIVVMELMAVCAQRSINDPVGVCTAVLANDKKRLKIFLGAPYILSRRGRWLRGLSFGVWLWIWERALLGQQKEFNADDVPQASLRAQRFGYAVDTELKTMRERQQATLKGP